MDDGGKSGRGSRPRRGCKETRISRAVVVTSSAATAFDATRRDLIRGPLDYSEVGETAAKLTGLRAVSSVGRALA
jgi:hypothetical protein